MKKSAKRPPLKKLTVMTLAALTDEGLYCDPETTGLYVQVTHKRKGTEYSAENGITRSWVYRFRSPITGKSRGMGLGPCACVTISEAREQARFARKLVVGRDDPIEYRNADQQAKIQAVIREQASRVTFRQCVEQAVPGMVAKSRNEKHQRQFKDSLLKACESFGGVSVAAIDSQMITKFLTPIWNTTPTTADRLRNRIERVLDWAKAKGFRAGENPAAWKGNLEHMLFSKPDKKKQRHYPALPYADLSAFMVQLRERNNTISRALEFCILTGSRSDQIRDVKWADIDLSKRRWIIPAEDMKSGVTHTVPLSNAAMSLLDALYQSGPHHPDDYVFPGTTGKRFSESGLLDTLHAMKVPVTPLGPVTVHGFRTTFADWGRERGKFQPDMVEHALAHSVGTKVAQAYTRGTYLEARTMMMEAWGSYCEGTLEADNVAPLHA